jgi:hypothetical protein
MSASAKAPGTVKKAAVAARLPRNWRRVFIEFGKLKNSIAPVSKLSTLEVSLGRGEWLADKERGTHGSEILASLF